MPIIITLKSGYQIAVQGENWQELSASAVLGTIRAMRLNGRWVRIVKGEIAVTEEVPAALWNADLAAERAKREEAAKLQAGEEARLAEARRPVNVIKRALGLKK